MSNFDFLTTEWKDIHEAATKAESAAIPDPRMSYSCGGDFRQQLHPPQIAKEWASSPLIGNLRE